VKLDLGAVNIDLPKGKLVPTLIMAAGEEDTSAGAALGGRSLHKTASHRFRRALTMTVVPLRPDAPADEVIDQEIKSFLGKTGAKIVNQGAHSAGQLQGVLVESKFQAPNGMPLYGMAFHSFQKGFLVNVAFTMLDGDHVKKAREDFLAVLSTIEPGSLIK
jgi:hypothetical protein